MKISLYRIGFREEFDGDVRFCLAPPKSMILSISIDFFDVFCNFLVVPATRTYPMKLGLSLDDSWEGKSII